MEDFNTKPETHEQFLERLLKFTDEPDVQGILTIIHLMIKKHLEIGEPQQTIDIKVSMTSDDQSFINNV